MSDCPFCALSPDVGEVLLSNDECLALCREEPVLIGSVVLVPRAHRESVFELTPSEWTATHALLCEVKAKIDARLSPDGYNVGWNAGSVAGQEIQHCHLHVVPRFRNEPYAGRGIRYWLKQEANRRTDAG